MLKSLSSRLVRAGTPGTAELGPDVLSASDRADDLYLAIGATRDFGPFLLLIGRQPSHDTLRRVEDF
jgi:hypothetical protein